MSHYDQFYNADGEQDRRQWGPIDKSLHYNKYPVEIIEIMQHLSFCRGNVVKYVTRAEFKGNELEDLKKAQWYLSKEIQRIQKKESKTRLNKSPLPYVDDEMGFYNVSKGS